MNLKILRLKDEFFDTLPYIHLAWIECENNRKKKLQIVIFFLSKYWDCDVRKLG